MRAVAERRAAWCNRDMSASDFATVLRHRLRTATLLPLLLYAAAAVANPTFGEAEARAHELLRQHTAGLPGEVSITVHPLDPNSQLPACAALEAFLPTGTRAWGRISVGVRCDSPVVWTAYLQAQVAVEADYLVAARPLRAGQVLGPGDYASRRGDLTALPDNTLTDASQVGGHLTRIAVAAGQALRGDMLRVPHAVRQGQNVQVLSAGPGFQVSAEGRALSNAAVGDSVRVRLANGQVVTGTAQAGGKVEVAF